MERRGQLQKKKKIRGKIVKMKLDFLRRSLKITREDK